MATAHFEHGFELRLRKADALACSHRGACDADVDAALWLPYVTRQLDAIGADSIRAELRDYGAWDADELADDDENRARLVWIAACNIREDMRA